MGSLSIWHWLIVLVIVVLIFGTKKLRNMGGDVGGAVKNFKDAMSEEKSADVAPLNILKPDAAAGLIEMPVVKAAPKKRAPAKPKALASAPVKSTTANKPTVKKPRVKKPVTKKPVAKKALAK